MHQVGLSLHDYIEKRGQQKKIQLCFENNY